MRVRKVDEFYFGTVPNEETTRNWLDKIFANSTMDTTRTSIIYNKTNPAQVNGLPIFQNIWVPVKKVIQVNDEWKMSEDWTYYNVGVLPNELAELYWAQYSGNFLLGSKTVPDISGDAAELTIRIRAIVKKNLAKYLKLIELGGYTYDPLWNVDGEEIRQILENSGTTDVKSGMIRSDIGVQYDNRKTTHNVSAYDTTGVKTEYTDEIEGNGSNVPTGLQRVEMRDGEITVTSSDVSGGAISHANNGTTGASGSTTYEHKNAKNLVDGVETEYVVQAADTAFGQALTGGDKMHAEKLIRHGNIGVTKTTELINDARETLKYSIIQEFFDDINEAILVGIY